MRNVEKNCKLLGLHPKNINSKMSPEDHVTTGSKNHDSPYISFSKSMDASKLFAANSKDHLIRIATIEIELNDPNIEEFIDLTDEDVRARYLTTKIGINYAEKFQEVLIKGKIRPECVKNILELKN